MLSHHDAFPVVEGARQFKTANAVLYHFDVDNTTSLSLVVTANARLSDVTVIYFYNNINYLIL